MLKNCLNYHGSKARIFTQIEQHFPKDINLFLDLMCGGGDVALNTTANGYILNDKNFQLAGLLKVFKMCDYNTLVKHIDTIIDKYNLSKDDKKGFLKLRKNYNLRPIKESDELNKKNLIKYVKLYCLITHAFNYQMVFNSFGHYSVPSGCGRSYFNPTLRERLKDCCNTLKKIKTQIISKNFDVVLTRAIETFSNNDFIFVDPPYIITDPVYSRTVYLKWTEVHEKKLYELLNKLNEKNIKFMLTNMLQQGDVVNKQLEEFIKNYKVIDTSVETGFNNCSYQKAKKNYKEIIVMNY